MKLEHLYMAILELKRFRPTLNFEIDFSNASRVRLMLYKHESKNDGEKGGRHLYSHHLIKIFDVKQNSQDLIHARII